MGGNEHILSPDISRADYDNPRLCPKPQYHPEILATKLAFKSVKMSTSMKTFSEHVRQAAEKRAVEKKKEKAYGQRVCIAVHIENDLGQEPQSDPEVSASLLLQGLALGMQQLLEDRA